MNEFEFEDLAVQLTDMLEVALYFAGAKKDKLEDAAQAYVEALDELFENTEEIEIGVNEIIKTINHLKKTKQEFFN